jgi:glycosyltransferase involved in cell wall biosynthesis
MAAGLPVITTPYAGAKDDLIKHGECGYVLDAEVESWTSAALRLLQDDTHYSAFSAAAREAVKPYTFDNAAKGIIDAIRHLGGEKPA